MKKIKNEDFAKALQAIDNGQLFKEGKIIEKEYDGYVASIGASVINSGLLPTLSFYTDIDKKDKSNIRRYKLLQVIFAVMDDTAAGQASNPKTGLLDYVLHIVFENYNTRGAPLGRIKKLALVKVRQRFLAAAVAVKLAMRNFEQSDVVNKNAAKA